MPLGIQNFEKLRTEDYAYVDKTHFIWALSRRSSAYFLSRPRRFGKSLLLSTMEAYFLGKRELFDGLAIQALEDGQENPWQEYPVLYLDLNPEKYTEKEDLIHILKAHLDNWEEIYKQKIIDESIPRRFFNVIQLAYKITGRQVVLLVDEYDKPLLQSLTKPNLNETYREILKSFYSVIKSADKYLRFVFLTGVTRFSKISIFSDLNNLTDISLQKNYAEICGITQKELETNFQAHITEVAGKNDISVEKTLQILKKQYDGYKFAKTSENLYNPFSLLNALEAADFAYYWFATGTPAFLVDYLKEGNYSIPDLDGNIFLSETGLTSYKADTKNPLPILFQSGYLTIKKYDNEYKLYTLGFPNDEVRYGFLENLLPSYTGIDETNSDFSIVEFTKDIKAGKVAAFMERMKGIISNIPYDNFTEKELQLREQNYQAAVYLIFALMGQFVRTEVHCATGRTDCEVETETTIYIFEFKLETKASAEEALQQIKEKSYTDKYSASKKQIILIGVGFDEKNKTIGEYLITVCG